MSQCPPPSFPEFAFVGRSNVGKSSLINMLVGRNNLARISSNPGKTITINHFEIESSNNLWYLVDLPGYGYASVSQTTRAAWKKNMDEYLLKRDNLHCVFVLVDGRIDPQKSDIEFINWLGKHQVPFAIVMTKTDKVKPNQRANSEKKFREELMKWWEETPTIIQSSAQTKKGQEEILNLISESIQSSDRD